MSMIRELKGIAAVLLCGLSPLCAGAESSPLAPLKTLTTPPLLWSDDTPGAKSISLAAGDFKSFYFQGLPYQGHPTRVFAWAGIPRHQAQSRVPGIVLVHGGGGTAFPEWVKRWVDHGYAAISIATEGQIDVLANESQIKAHQAAGRWVKHAMAGPVRAGTYGDGAVPLEDQWMYHAVADAALAHSLLGALADVDPQRIGIMGVSWGGIITSTVMGLDERLAFAIPVYGCGGLAGAQNEYGRAVRSQKLYMELWDPILRIAQAKMPSLWLSWTGDPAFPLDQQAATYAPTLGSHMVALVPNLTHSHQAAWLAPDSYAFADSVVKEGQPWCVQSHTQSEGGLFSATFRSSKPLDRAELVVTTDTGLTNLRKWQTLPANLVQQGPSATASGRLPPQATAWFINVYSGKLTASSDFQQVPLAPSLAK